MTSSINFSCKVCGKMLMIMIELFNVNFVTIGFTSIAIILIILTANFFKIPMILGILCCSRIFPFNSMKSNKNYSICVSNFHNNNIKQILILAILNNNINFSNNNKPGKTINNEASLLLKSSENVKLLVNQFNNDASP